MSKTTDVRLSGWVINSNLFEEDFKFSDLIEEKGALSFLIYVILRGKMSLTNGYYIELTDSLIRKIHKNLGRCSKGQPHIKEMILYFGELGILDSAYLKNNILTSLDIQKEWLKAKQSKRAKISADNLKHWLLVDTMPTPADDKCNINDDKCSNYDNKCNIYSDNCGHNNTQQNTTRELVKYNLNNNISENEEFTRDKVLSIIYGKHPNIEKFFDERGVTEKVMLYAEYWTHACNDTRWQAYNCGLEKVAVNNDFFIQVLNNSSATAVVYALQECYERQKDITQSVEQYFRGILVHQNVKLAKELQNKYQRGQQ